MNTGIQFSDQLVIAAQQNIPEKNYWLEQLSGELQKSGFPYDYPGKAGDNLLIDFVGTRFPGELFPRLMEISNHSDVRLFIIMAAALMILLAKYTQNNDIIVGTSIYHQEKETRFINTVLAIRNRLDGDMSGREFLKQVGQRVFEANKYQNYPVEILLKQLGIPLDQNDGFPLFGTAILLENIHDKRYLRHIRLDMIFHLRKEAGGMEIELEYNSSLYKKETPARIMAHFLRLLQEIIFNVNLRLPDLDMLSGDERREILFDFNNTGAGYSRDSVINHLFSQQAAKTPDRVAVIGPGVREKNRHIVSMSYRELQQQCFALALLLRERGIRPNRFAGVIMERSLEMVMAVMAILEAGGAYVPLEPYLPEARLVTCLSSLKVEWVLTDDSCRGKVEKISTELPGLHNIISLNQKFLRGVQGAPWHGGSIRDGFVAEDVFDNSTFTCNLHLSPLAEKRPPGRRRHESALASDIAYVIFTSGTTGIPKGVVETHRPVVNVIQWVNNTFEVGKGDKLLVVVSLSFDLSVYDIFGLLAGGGSIRAAGNEEIKSPEQLLEIIFREGITFWDSAPAAFQLLVPYLQDLPPGGGTGSHKPISALRLVFLSGDWIPVTMPDILKAVFAGVRVIGLGGATEAAIWSNYYPIERVDPGWCSIPYGKPIQNAKYYILDLWQQPCPVGVAGALFIGGECLASGYINDEALTAKKFIDNPFVPGEKMYRTGDLARWFPDGNMEFLGRQDNQVKIRGFRIELGEIESQLLMHDEIKTAVVSARGEVKGDQYLCAYYVADKEFEDAELSGYLSKTLPDYMIPPYFVKLDRMPLTSNGKLDRKALPGPALGVKADADEYFAPRNEIEKKIVEIWSDILRIEKEKISINSNFFDLGGHSLNATLLISRINKELNVRLPLSEIFLNPTTEALSEYIKGTVEEKYRPIEPLEKKEYYDISFSQRQLWILDQLEEDQIAYNITTSNTFNKLNRETLEHAFETIIKRHEILRTTFIRVGGEPKQKVHSYESTGFNIDYIDLRGDENPEEALKTLSGKEVNTPFHLEKGPLIRAKLFHIKDQHYIFLVTMHHIISDGWSMQILLNETIILYKDYYMRKEETLPPLEIQYKDFAAWQNQELTGESLNIHQEYWLERFKGEIPVLNLETDYPRPPIKTYKGVVISLDIDKTTSKGLNSINWENGVSLFMTMAAAVITLLHRYTGQEDIIIGLPVSGREHFDLENQVGFYVNTLALRIKFAGNETFNRLLLRVKEAVLEAYEHQVYPFDQLVENLNFDRDMSRSPLFDVLVQCWYFEDEGDQTQEDTESPSNDHHYVDYKGSKFDMVFNFVEIGERLKGSLIYNTDLFERESILIIIEKLKTVFREIVLDPGIPLEDLDIEIDIEKEMKKDRSALAFDFE